MTDIYVQVIESSQLVEVISDELLVTVDDEITPAVIEVGIPGPAGPAGEQGEQGEPGAPGSAPQAYTHTQAIANDVWTVIHSLGYRPNVHIEDSLGRDVDAEIVHDTVNQLTINFSASLSGAAYLS